MSERSYNVYREPASRDWPTAGGGEGNNGDGFPIKDLHCQRSPSGHFTWFYLAFLFLWKCLCRLWIGARMKYEDKGSKISHLYEVHQIIEEEEEEEEKEVSSYLRTFACRICRWLEPRIKRTDSGSEIVFSDNDRTHSSLDDELEFSGCEDLETSDEEAC